MYYDIPRPTKMYYDILHYNVLQAPLLNTKHLSCIHTLTHAHLLQSTSRRGATTKHSHPQTPTTTTTTTTIITTTTTTWDVHMVTWSACMHGETNHNKRVDCALPDVCVVDFYRFLLFVIESHTSALTNQ